VTKWDTLRNPRRVSQPAVPRERPFGVTVLAILYAIDGLYCLIAAFIVDSIFEMVPMVDDLPVVGDILDTVKLCMMIVLIIIAIFYFLVALGMLKGQNWARRVGILLAIAGLINIPVGTIISIIIPIYLFKPDIKAWFQK
jgi:hypothetical protein